MGRIMQTVLDGVDSSQFVLMCVIEYLILKALHKRCDYMNIYKILLFPQNVNMVLLTM